MFFGEAFLFFLLLLFQKFLGFFAFIFAEEVTNANLALIVAAEAVDAARLEEDHGVVLSSGDCDNVIALVGVEVFNFLSVGD